MGIVCASKNPMGIYLLFSEDTLGTMIYLSGFLISRKTVGVSASFCRSGAPFSRSCLHSSTLFATSGIFLSSAGLAPTSHRQYRFLLFMNSSAPVNFFMNGSAAGSFLMNSSYSSASMMRCPPSAGRFPVVMYGTSQRGFGRLSTNTFRASSKYPLISLTTRPLPRESKRTLSFPPSQDEKPIITQCTAAMCFLSRVSLVHRNVW